MKNELLELIQRCNKKAEENKVIRDAVGMIVDEFMKFAEHKNVDKFYEDIQNTVTIIVKNRDQI